MPDLDLTTFTMQIIDNDPEGIKICRVQGSTLVAVVVPRRLLARLKDLPDIPTRGVYYLLQQEEGRLRRVYAGKTTNGINRLDSHNSQKDWWNLAVMFLAPQNEMSEDVVSGLEAKAINYLRESCGFEVDNTTVPDPYVNPYNVAYIKRLHDEMLFCMAVLGYSLNQVKRIGDPLAAFESDVPVPAANAPVAVAPDVARIFYTRRRGIRALGCYYPSKDDPSKGTFEVLPGSEVDLATPTGATGRTNDKVEKVRQELLTTGGLAKEGGRFVLKVARTFKNPSAAAVFVLGGSQNGWTEWVDAQGVTLDAAYRKGASTA